jgi:ABC-type antimicrobial peptide transport system permease subunit
VDVRVAGVAPLSNENMSAIRVSIGPDYATVMGTRLLIGRDILKTDRSTTMRVVVVNETFARRFYASTASALGHRIDAGRGWATIVGVVADGKYGSLTEKPQAVAYFPITQWYEPSFTLFIRAETNPAALEEPIRRAMQSLYVDLPALQPRTLAQHVAAATFVQRTGATVLGSVGAVALALSLIGLYGALGIVVSLRRQEIGIRLTLGATPMSIALLVMRQGVCIATGGIVVGVPLVYLLSGLLRAQFGSQGMVVSASALAVTAALVMVAAVGAMLRPVHRAASLSPAAALRTE